MCYQHEVINSWRINVWISCTALIVSYICKSHVQTLNLITISMNKADIIDAMAADAGISKAQAKKALDSFTGNVANTLASDGRVSLVGFGSFSVSKRSAREGRNPQTGATIQIPAKNVARFKPGAELNEKLK